MESHINFIGREKEINDILEYLKGKSDVPGKAIFIRGDGGFGKTRLLDELPGLIMKEAKGLTVNQVIDFDNKKFSSPENINSSMIKGFSGDEGFENYYELLEKVQEIERLNLNTKALEDEKRKVVDEFIKAYNQLVDGKQVWFFDTVEKLCEFDEDEKNIIGRNEDIINDWIFKIPRLKNTYFIFSGRPSGIDSIRKTFSDNDINTLLIKLEPFSEDESRSYISEKQKNLHISIKEEQAEKLIQLADGKPILLDLAVEWFVQEVDMTFLNEIKIPEEESSQKEPEGKQKEFEEKQKEFEKKLVGKISELRSPLDSTTFALAHVYPIDEDGFNILFMDKTQGGIDFDRVKKVVYIKTLPSGAIKLHDEMERLVKDYSFSSIDRSLKRRS